LSDTALWGVQRNDIDTAWPAVREIISDALERSGRHTPEEILSDLRSGEAQLWLAWADDAILGVCVTYIMESERKKVCRLWLCTGHDRKRWVHHVKTIEEWAQSVGCHAMDAVVRPGWEKVLRDYKKTHVILEREL
tara:strand:+ start:416 stop:823 length:408 start_codon:yes stop_codon:yes gene_type:complete